MKLINFLSIVALLLSIGCSSYITKYYFEPTQGSKINLDLNGRYNYLFEAENFKIRLDPDADRFGFRIFNNSKENIYIVWNQIKVTNVTDIIELKDFKPTQKEDLIKDTVGNVIYSLTLVNPDSNYNDELPLEKFIAYKSNNETELDSLAALQIGKQILIQIPLMINSVVSEYKFPFEVVSYDVRRK